MKFRDFAGNMRNPFSRLMTEVSKTDLFLLLVLAIILIYPLLFVGFTTVDDTRTAINAGHEHIWTVIKKRSEGQGRFSFWWSYPVSQVPYLFENRFWYLITKYGSFSLLLGALYYAVSRSFKSSWIALASLLFFLAFIQNEWDHNALTSYPFSVNFFGLLFLVSLGLFATAIERNNLTLAGFAGGMYFLTLSGEFFVLFFPFYVAILLSRAELGETVRERLISGKKYMLAVGLPLMGYLVAYMVWRIIYSPRYPGTQLELFSLLETGRVVLTYSLSAFPFSSLHFMFSSSSQLPFVNTPGWITILSGANATHLIKPLVAGLLFTRLMTTVSFTVPKTRILVFGATLTLVGIFLPNLLLGFIQKHHDWVKSGVLSYLYTYISFISAVVFMALILAYVNLKSQSWHPKLRLAFIFMGIVCVMAISFAVEVKNQFVAFDQKLSHRKWQLMDEVIESPTFRTIRDGSIVVAPTLAANYHGIAYANNKYWSAYIKYKTGKNIQFVDHECKSEAPCYSLVFRQEKHSDNQFIVLSTAKHPDLLGSSEMTIYQMPYKADAVITGTFLSHDALPKLEINGVPIVNKSVAGSVGLFSSKLPGIPENGRSQITKVTGNVDILPLQIAISHFGVEPHLRSLSKQLAAGIDFKTRDYPSFITEVSGMSGHEPWGRWTDATVGPVARFRFRQALPRKFVVEITAGAIGPNIGAPVRVRVGAVEKTTVITSFDLNLYRLEFESDGIVDTLEIIPPSPISAHEVDPNNPDSRRLGIRFSSIKIKSQDGIP